MPGLCICSNGVGNECLFDEGQGGQKDRTIPTHLNQNHSLDEGEFGNSGARGVDHHDLTFVIFEPDSSAHDCNL
jgi:hypothetical protein